MKISLESSTHWLFNSSTKSTEALWTNISGHKDNSGMNPFRLKNNKIFYNNKVFSFYYYKSV